MTLMTHSLDLIDEDLIRRPRYFGVFRIYTIYQEGTSPGHIVDRVVDDGLHSRALCDDIKTI
jgi:hypothetical protein